MTSKITKRKKRYSLIAMLVVLVTCLFFSCKKNNIAAPADTAQIEAMRAGSVAAIGADTPTTTPINYMVTKKCSTSCKAGDCNVEITYDIRVMSCSPSCKCGGTLGLYPDCKENCSIITPTTSGPSGNAIPFGKTIYRHEVTANADNLKFQSELIAKYRSSTKLGNQELANQLQLIYELFKMNNGRLTGSQVALYSAYIKSIEKITIVDQ